MFILLLIESPLLLATLIFCCCHLLFLLVRFHFVLVESPVLLVKSQIVLLILCVSPFFFELAVTGPYCNWQDEVTLARWSRSAQQVGCDRDRF